MRVGQNMYLYKQLQHKFCSLDFYETTYHQRKVQSLYFLNSHILDILRNSPSHGDAPKTIPHFHWLVVFGMYYLVIIMYYILIN